MLDMDKINVEFHSLYPLFVYGSVLNEKILFVKFKDISFEDEKNLLINLYKIKNNDINFIQFIKELNNIEFYSKFFNRRKRMNLIIENFDIKVILFKEYSKRVGYSDFFKK